MTLCAPPTTRQTDVLASIENYRHVHGYSPTFQELGDDLGISKVSVFEHVNALEKNGHLRRDRHKARSLEVIPHEAPPNRNTKLPLLGNIAGGRPITAIEYRDEIDLDTMFHAKDGVYALRARGDGFVDHHIADGDYIIIERRIIARNGEKIIGIIDGSETILARFYGEGEMVRLQPDHAAYEARIILSDRLRIHGVVIGMVRGDF